MEYSSEKISINLLGGLSLEINSKPISLPKSRKARALLAYAAATPQPVRKQALCNFLFVNTSNPKANLRWCLSRLKQALPEKNRSLIQSDQNSIWLSCEDDDIDVRYLQTLRGNIGYGLPELKYLSNVGHLQFLPEIVVSSSAEFETWRSTMQVSHEQTIEEVLERAVLDNEGSELALAFAKLFTECAPYSETGWYLLITALQKGNQKHRAQQFLNIAVTQLRDSGIVQSGLLANAAQVLREQQGSVKVVNSETKSTIPAASTAPALIVSTKEITEPEAVTNKTFLDEIRLAAGTNKSTLYIHEPKSEDYQFTLIPNISCGENGVSIDIKLMEQTNGQCLSVWSTLIAGAPSDEMIRDFRLWLGMKFELELSVTLIAIALQKPEENRNEQDFYYAAFPKIYSPAGYAVHGALSLLRQSLRINPNFGPALCSIAWVRSTHSFYNQKKNERKKTIAIARRALELSYDDPFVLSWAAITLGHMECDPLAGLNFVHRALSLNPYSPFGHLALGVLSHYATDFEKSIMVIENMRKTDSEPIAFILNTYLALNYYQIGEYIRALDLCKTALAQNPSYVVTLRTKISCLIRVGRVDEAREEVSRLVELDSSETLEYFRAYLPYIGGSAKKKLIHDLERAGLP